MTKMCPKCNGWGSLSGKGCDCKGREVDSDNKWMTVCSDCDGDGEDSDGDECYTCDETGKVSDSSYGCPENLRCPTCTCPVCNGEGSVDAEYIYDKAEWQTCRNSDCSAVFSSGKARCEICTWCVDGKCGKCKSPECIPKPKTQTCRNSDCSAAIPLDNIGCGKCGWCVSGECGYCPGCKTKVPPNEPEPEMQECENPDCTTMIPIGEEKTFGGSHNIQFWGKFCSEHKGTTNEPEPEMQTCPNCSNIFPATTKSCPKCQECGNPDCSRIVLIKDLFEGKFCKASCKTTMIQNGSWQICKNQRCGNIFSKKNQRCPLCALVIPTKPKMQECETPDCSRMVRIPKKFCKPCAYKPLDDWDNVPGLTGRHSTMSGRRRIAEDNIQPFEALCAWILALTVGMAVFLIERHATIAKRDSMQRGQRNRENPTMF